MQDARKSPNFYIGFIESLPSPPSLPFFFSLYLILLPVFSRHRSRRACAFSKQLIALPSASSLTIPMLFYMLLICDHYFMVCGHASVLSITLQRCRGYIANGATIKLRAHQRNDTLVARCGALPIIPATRVRQGALLSLLSALGWLASYANDLCPLRR